MTDDLRERARQIIDEMPDWAVPICVKALERQLDGIPIAEVERLFKQELAAAKEARQPA